MDKIKKGLGRGLSSLIGETKVEVQKNQLLLSLKNDTQKQQLELAQLQQKINQNNLRDREQQISLAKVQIDSASNTIKDRQRQVKLAETQIEKLRALSEGLDYDNVEDFEKKFPWQLSGGMQQRVSIARALAFDADILLMDEPFGALDEIVRDYLNEQLLKLWHSTKKTICFVTHSIPEAVYLSTKIVVMSPRPGRIIDIIESDLPDKRPLEIRDTKEFIDIAQRVREGLRAGHSYE